MAAPYPQLVGLVSVEHLKAGWPHVYPGNHHHLAAADGRLLPGGGAVGQFMPVGGGVPLMFAPIGGAGGQFGGPFGGGVANFGRAPSPSGGPPVGLVNFGRVQSPTGPAGPAPSFYIPLDPRLHHQHQGMCTFPE